MVRSGSFIARQKIIADSISPLGGIFYCRVGLRHYV